MHWRILFHQVQPLKFFWQDVTEVNVILEIAEDGIEKGNVEQKVYNPRNNKKKGATRELRKMSGHDYSYSICLIWSHSVNSV